MLIIIGERPYNDDSLLSDSMTIDQEVNPMTEDSSIMPDMPSTQIGKDVNELSPSNGDSTVCLFDPPSNELLTDADNTPMVNSSTPLKRTMPPKKDDLTKKKKTTERK